MIPYGRHDVTEADIEAVVGVLRSDFLTQGPAVPAFEQRVAARLHARRAVAVNSGTSALHVACLALDLGPGGRLWTVPNTFVASANCGRYCGADVDFVDIDPQTWNLSVPKLKDKLAAARRTGTVPTVVVPVHFAGQPTEQEAIWDLAQEFGFKVIEDASHALGAARNGESVGSCRWSHVTVFSLHPVKIVTAGEGGLVLTNDNATAERMAVLRAHGITRSGPWSYDQRELGFNYRMTDIHASLAASQLERLDCYVERRNTLARRYDEALCGLPIRLPTVASGNRSAFHLYVVRLHAGGATARGRVLEELRQRGIGANVHYPPVHLQPYYRQHGFGPGQFPEAEAHGDSAITLPLYPTLTEQQQDRVIRALQEVLAD